MSHFNGSIYVPARDLQRAADWYHEKFGTKKPRRSRDDTQEVMICSFSSGEDDGIWIGTEDGPAERPILFIHGLEKAREYLLERGVTVGEIEHDEQGNSFFEFQDLDGNRIEVCKEH